MLLGIGWDPGPRPMGVTSSHGYGGPPTALEAEGLLRYPPARWSGAQQVMAFQLWPGWGCSLSWLGKALGCSREAESWADLLFSTRDVPVSVLWPRWAGPYMPSSVPGLGLSLARYNVGGCGRPEEQCGHPYGGKVRGWFALIEGFQCLLRALERPPKAFCLRPQAAGEFDWTRDEGQRNFLHLAVERGVDQVELFSNSPTLERPCKDLSHQDVVDDQQQLILRRLPVAPG